MIRAPTPTPQESVGAPGGSSTGSHGLLLAAASVVFLTTAGIGIWFARSPAPVPGSATSSAAPAAPPVTAKLTVDRLDPRPGALLVTLDSEPRSCLSTRVFSIAPPSRYPVDATGQASRCVTSGRCTRVEITADQVTRALLDRLRLVPGALVRAPEFAELEQLAKSVKKLDEARARDTVQRRLRVGHLLELWQTVHDFVPPLFSSRPEIARVDRLLQPLGQLEDLGQRLRSFHLPGVPESKSPLPDTWQPGAGRSLPAEVTTSAVLSCEPTTPAVDPETQRLMERARRVGITLRSVPRDEDDPATRSNHPWARASLHLWPFQDLAGKTYALPRTRGRCTTRLQGVFTLPRGFRCRGALVAVFPTFMPRMSLRVRLNDLVTLRLHDPEIVTFGAPPRFAFHRFDPAILREGKNDLVVQAVAYLGGATHAALVHSLIIGLDGYQGPPPERPFVRPRGFH
ncbi:MAG: hypothetical protein HY815_29975 [Candidatus Riflebacteria bacterium]|nr:hypothetical protein [Candidatus Riflebacteria bacterium]